MKYIPACLSLLAAVAAFPAGAGVDGPAAARADGASTAKSSSVNALANGSQLRCWQYGNLIFEENGLSPPQLQDHEEALAFTKSDKGREQIYVFQFNETVCMFRDVEQD